MKTKLMIVAVILSLAIPSASMAAPIDFSGGVHDEHMYEEIVFITGEPIKFVGQVKATTKDKSDTSSVTYGMKLSVHEDYKGKFEKAEYKKSVTYDTKYLDHNAIGQTIGTTTVGKYSESLEVDGVKFVLKDYQFSKSDTIDKRPASDFYSGDITGRKYYAVEGNGLKGTVVVNISGTNVGYENFWGHTETQSINNTITSNIVSGEGGGNDSGSIRTGKWTGTVNLNSSDSLTKKLMYSNNDAHLSSFEGGHVKVTNKESVSKYRYGLPGKSGTLSLSLLNVPRLDRLIVPKFRDINNHWAADSIQKLYSLDVFGDSESIFSPDTPMGRLDFIKAVVKSCDIRSTEEGKKKSRKQLKEESVFADLSVNHPDYEYVKSGLEKGIITGTQDRYGNRTFEPEKDLTRAEAITILIRALGFENRAPNPGYTTSFSDDKKIPSWAKDSIYMAKEINLVQGDSANRVNPDKVLSRAEASAMLVKFLEFLEHDLQKDYRENKINFN